MMLTMGGLLLLNCVNASDVVVVNTGGDELATFSTPVACANVWHRLDSFLLRKDQYLTALVDSDTSEQLTHSKCADQTFEGAKTLTATVVRKDAADRKRELQEQYNAASRER